MATDFGKFLDGIGLGQVWTLFMEAVPDGDLAKLNEVGAENLSSALKELIEGKAGAATTLEGYGITNAYTIEGANAAIKAAVDSAVTGIYKVKGSVAFADLPTEGVEVGWVYNISDDFTTTEAFMEGAGHEHKAGTNVTYTENGWDCMAGIYDFSDFVMVSDIQALTTEEIAAICTMPTV